MKTVRIAYSSEGEGFQAWIDGVELDCANGTAEFDVADGVHYLYWLAWGPPEARVKVRITHPIEAVFSEEAPIGPDFKNFWHHRFHVGVS